MYLKMKKLFVNLYHFPNFKSDKKIININLFYFFSIVLFISFLLFRNPEILIQGRFFAEEGAIFWSYSLNNSILEMLLFTPVSGGYFLLNTNLQIILSNLVPLNYSPLVTVWTSILISFLPSFIFFLVSKNSYSSKNRLTVSILFLLLPSLNLLEVFANSINSQTYLGFTSFLIITKGLNSSYFLKTQIFILFLGFFSGYYSLVLLPILIIRYFKESNCRVLLPIIFGIFSIFLNLNILFYSFNNKILYSGKLDSNTNFEYIYTIAKKSLLVNLFTEKLIENQKLGLILVFIFLMLTFIIFISKNNNNKENFSYLYIALILEIFLIFFGQAGNVYDQRYAVVVSSIFIFIIIEFLVSFSKSWYLTLILILVSIINFNYQRSLYFIDCGEYCISWSEQVSNLENNPILIHWPIGEGEPYWYTNYLNPTPTPAPFQVELLEEGYQKYFQLSLFDIIAENFSR